MLPFFYQLNYFFWMLCNMPGRSLFRPQRTDGANIHAFAAGCAGRRFSPGLIEIRNNPRFVAAAHNVPGMRPFHFIANAHTARAENAAVMIDNKFFVGRVSVAIRKNIRKTDMVHSGFLRVALKIAIIIRDTN